MVRKVIRNVGKKTFVLPTVRSVAAKEHNEKLDKIMWPTAGLQSRREVESHSVRSRSPVGLTL
jgi:hypothetical protein